MIWLTIKALTLSRDPSSRTVSLSIRLLTLLARLKTKYVLNDTEVLCRELIVSSANGILSFPRLYRQCMQGPDQSRHRHGRQL